MNAVYAIPNALDLVDQLKDVPDALHARLSAFLRNPDNDSGLQIARDLDGARVAVMRICQALQMECQPPRSDIQPTL